jgi:hypothetical protein
MSTEAGTVAALVLLLARLTTKAWLRSALLRVTVPVAVPPISGIDGGLIASDSAGPAAGRAWTVS